MELYFKVWKNYVVFSGRATRTEYWFFVIVNMVLIILLGGMSALMTRGESDPTSNPMFYVYIAFDLAIFLPTLAVTVRRLHDSGKSGLWILMLFIPLLGQVVLFIMMLLGSQEEENRHGPYQGTTQEVSS
ncbi:MAG: DUF805 domain-containing protein [bacterium]|nr:DUF805 domain-containing protein [bacterium]MCP4799496.1 DUF805 domain-containing protein [bacterium]